MKALFIFLVALAGVAAADPDTALRAANDAATAGDWPRVEQLVAPLLAPTGALSSVDRAEADRLAGLAAFFAQRTGDAERDFVAYLKLDLDGHLDPALYPPEVVNFFNDVRARHASELHAIKPPPKRYWPLALVPPFAQFQNGDRVKGIVVTGLLGAFLAANITTYLVLRSWCHNPGGTCDDSGKNHYRSAQRLTEWNTFAGVGFILTYAYGVWDGVRGYRRGSHELAPSATATDGGAALGMSGRF
ncbi:hypothetical protein BH11MYX1_BH11MYX1_17550 [soil metagenome]